MFNTMETESFHQKNGALTTYGGEDVVEIPLSIDEHNVIEGAREILKVIRPSWRSDSIRFKLFTDGITNKLVGCFHTATRTASVNPSQESPSTEDVVLIRVYGNKTDLLIDRQAETRNIKLLFEQGFAPRLYAVFRNGLAYEYVPGVTLNPETVCKDTVWQLVARRLAEMHMVQTPAHSNEPMLKSKIEQFLDLIPERFTNPSVHARCEKQFLPVKRLREEFLELYAHLERIESPVVFAHNDLLLGNVIYTETLGKVTFIDYEYAGYNFQAFDIGNHFAEFAGIDEVDYTRYPTKEFQYEWLRVYLETRSVDGAPVSQDDVHRLYVQVNQFALASHLFWAFWALIQAEHSSITFDFVQFAQVRYAEYWARKSEFLSLTFSN